MDRFAKTDTELQFSELPDDMTVAETCITAKDQVLYAWNGSCFCEQCALIEGLQEAQCWKMMLDSTTQF